MVPYVDRFASGVRHAEKALAREVYEQQRLLKQRIPYFLRHGSLLNLLTTPIIYSLSLPFLLLDLWVTAYQWVCFPVYGIALVRRQRYLVIDRHKLAYLNAIEKANCTYCSYANGVLAYVREVAARTEQYWCPIKHSRRITATHGRYHRFFDYGDGAGYRHGLALVRKGLQGRRAPRARATRVKR